VSGKSTNPSEPFRPTNAGSTSGRAGVPGEEVRVTPGAEVAMATAPAATTTASTTAGAVNGYVNGVLTVASAGVTAAGDDAEADALWAQINRLRPLPTVDGSTHLLCDPGPEERLAIESLWRNLPEGFKQDSRDLILRAYVLASNAHRNT
jgi:hypothetical protein